MGLSPNSVRASTHVEGSASGEEGGWASLGERVAKALDPMGTENSSWPAETESSCRVLGPVGNTLCELGPFWEGMARIKEETAQVAMTFF